MKKTISSSPKMVTKFDPCRKIRPLSQQLTSQYQTKPPVPCGGIICMAYLLSMVGVPAEAISVVVCIDPLAAMFNGVCNESANITTSFVLAKSYKKLNEEVYLF